ncbi:hypothetical protein BXP70_18950 [Hymenobacter crusticola]|uniref:Uncharacterized protein n=1 Tax=Hymenobacter crusticola TaxID=1770526 RepID=A0A243W9X8_9BACT|nr:hypothetical protein BXP70_18950 [Hymenobacter crusticola]
MFGRFEFHFYPAKQATFTCKGETTFDKLICDLAAEKKPRLPGKDDGYAEMKEATCTLTSLSSRISITTDNEKAFRSCGRPFVWYRKSAWKAMCTHLFARNLLTS